MPEPFISAESARTLGAQLRKAREGLGLSQERVAQDAGISRNQLQLIELGLSDRSRRSPANPRLSTLLALCQVLGVTARIDTATPDGLVIDIGSSGPEAAGGQ